MNFAITSSSTVRASKAHQRSPVMWLLVGAVLLALSDMRWGVGVLAWFAPVPFLYYLCVTQGWRARMWLFLTLLVASHLSVAKIVTPPVSFALVPMFALPAALSLFVILLLWYWVRRRAGMRWAMYTFPALVVLNEWSQHGLGEFGTWGALANTQLNNLPLLQTVSLFGMSGIAFVMSWAAVLMAELLHGRNLKVWKWHIIVFVAAIFAAYVYGSVRLFNDHAGPTVQTAAVVTDLIFTGLIPEDDELVRNNDTLFRRSEAAARQGARIIVWNEGATLVYADAEQSFIVRAKALARKHNVHLVPAYIVPVTLEPLTFENKYLWIRPDGSVAEEYFKHHPVPGEGSIKGTAPLKVLETAFGKVAGAICYDYDFPEMSREHARLGAGLVVLPSSDWKGIDPIHTQMARVRAIEGGFSLLRPARAAASAGFDAYGRVRGWMNYFENNDRILIATLPTQPVTTLYSRIGDIAVYLCMGLLVWVSLILWRRRSE